MEIHMTDVVCSVNGSQSVKSTVGQERLNWIWDAQENC